MTIRPAKPLVAAGLALLSACGPEQTPQPPVRPVLSIVVAKSAPHALGFTGTVEPRYKVDLGFRVLGRIVSRNAEVGNFVKAGDQLAAIDALALELAVRSATADVVTARARLANAAGVEGRQRTLAERNVSTQSQLEGAELAQETANAALKRAEASLAKTKEQLGYARLTTDTDGVVVSIGAQVGQVVSPGQAVVTVARPDVREAAVDVPEDIARELKVGSAFNIALQLNPAIQTPGQVREIAPQADQITRTRRIKIALPEATDGFRLGTTITAGIVTPPPTGSIELPRTALFERDGKTLIWIVDPAAGTVASRGVKVLARANGTIQVADDLEDGTRVVIAGVASLVPGQRVKIIGEAGR